MIVALDCDGVLAYFVGRFLRQLSELTGKSYDREQVTDYGFRCLGVEPATRRAAFDAMSRPGIAASLDVLPGAREGVHALRGQGFELVIATSPLPSSPTWAYERERWLAEHFGFERNQIVHTSAKHLVAADVLVDDSPEHCLAVRASGDRCGILWDAPYNRHTRMVPRRVRSWEELSLELNALRNGVQV